MQNEREKLLYSYSIVWGKIWQKKLWMLKQEANKVDAIVALDLNIVLICDSRMNFFEKRGNDTIHARVG
jgi:hypothetical protein